jgi:hypothetical protein
MTGDISGRQSCRLSSIKRAVSCSRVHKRHVEDCSGTIDEEGNEEKVRKVRWACSDHSSREQQHLDIHQPQQQRRNGDDVDRFGLSFVFILDQLPGISELCVCDNSSK